MKIYADTADVKQVELLSGFFPLAGVTTNPSITAASGEKLNVVLPQLRQALGHDGLLFAQVIATETDAIVNEAIRLHKYVDNLVVKIPVNQNGLAAIQILKAEGIRTLGTAIYNASQGLLAALAGAEFIAPYVNRIDMLSGNGIQTVELLVNLLNMHAPHCKVLCASFKNTQQVLACFAAGCDSVTIPVDIALKMLENPAVDAAIAQFQNDWKSVYGELTI
ncbi:fructose-6-phosphate aldolase [Aeromonas veronii]|uniref:fructose-6-phosphate aldolase n=1 Tax=Aeromonas veronii TaxID=654 RepID=UPI002F413D6A